jgi:hypothetical protein
MLKVNGGGGLTGGCRESGATTLSSLPIGSSPEPFHSISILRDVAARATISTAPGKAILSQSAKSLLDEKQTKLGMVPGKSFRQKVLSIPHSLWPKTLVLESIKH